MPARRACSVAPLGLFRETRDAGGLVGAKQSSSLVRTIAEVSVKWVRELRRNPGQGKFVATPRGSTPWDREHGMRRSELVSGSPLNKGDQELALAKRVNR